MPRPNRLLFLVVLGLFAACGGGGADAPTGPPTTTPPPPAPPPPPPTAPTPPLCPTGGEVNIAVGEQVISRNQSSYCFNFGSSGSVSEYLVGVQSVGEAGIAVRNITISGQLTSSVGQAPASAPPLPQSDFAAARRFSPELVSNPRFAMLQNHRESHRTIFERMIAPVREPGMREALRSGAQRSPAMPPGVVTGDEEIGDEIDFRIRIRESNSPVCEAPSTADITAEVRIKNDQSMWFVDVANPEGGFSDEQLQEMANLFDDHIYATESDHFGVPTDKDGNGVIGIVITQQINIDNGADTPVIGFVNPCDLFTREEDVGGSIIDTTNEGEFFYAAAPDPEGIHGQVMDTQPLFDFLPVVIAHEFAHIIQLSHRFTQDGKLMAQFLAEGQATLAEEIVGHSMLLNGLGQNLNVEVALDFEETQSYPWYRNPWIDLIYYFGWPGVDDTQRVPGAPGACTWTDAGDDDPCGSRPLWYGVTWSFLRWAGDQFGEDFGGEALFHQELINNNVSGFDNLREVLGPYGLLEDLFAQWAAAFYMDDRPGRSDPRHTVSSWNYLSADNRLTENAWLRPIRKSYSDLSEEIQVRDPSTAFFLLGGSIGPPYSLRVEGAGGGSLGSDMQVWLVRTR